MIRKAVKILLILIVTFAVTLGLAAWLEPFIVDEIAAVIICSMIGIVGGLAGCIPMLYVLIFDEP